MCMCVRVRACVRRLGCGVGMVVVVGRRSAMVGAAIITVFANARLGSATGRLMAALLGSAGAR